MLFDWMARDGRIILLEKAVRTVPYGFLAVVFPIYLTQLKLNPFEIGVVLTITVATSAFYTLAAGLLADGLGRRRTLVFFALTDATAGALLLTSTSLWAPVAAGIVGNMSVGAGETGPFLSLEQAILPGTSDIKRRTLTYSVYNLIGYGFASAGSLLAGVPQYLGSSLTSYRPLFLAYLASGLIGAILYSRLTRKVESAPSKSVTLHVLSKESKPIVLRLSELFAVDAFGGGFIVGSILSLYFYERYSLQLSSLGLLFSATQIVTAGSFLVSERIARRIGLLRTMVFSHVPSNLFLLAVPFAPSAITSVFLLLCRQSLSQMDVPARQSYLMSIIPESDRTPAAGLTNVSRSFAQSVSPSVAGYTILNLWLGSPFIFGGLLKLSYDLLLYRNFRKTEPPQESTRPLQVSSGRPDASL